MASRPPQPSPPTPDEPADARGTLGGPSVPPRVSESAFATAGPSDPTPASLSEGALCPECGYDVRGLTSPRCPECGTDLADVRAGKSQIPWAHRRTLGTGRAFWRTVWFVTWNKRFAKQLALPVDFAESQSFRWRCVAWAYLPIALYAAAVLGIRPLYRELAGDGDLLAWGLSGLLIWTLLCLLALPGVTSYFVQSRHFEPEYENRLIALNYYAWAPLAWTPAAVLAIAGGLLTWYLSTGPPVQLADCVGVAVVGAAMGYMAALLLCLANFYRLLRTGFPGRNRAALRWLGATGACLATALLALLAPAGVIWLALVFYSLT